MLHDYSQHCGYVASVLFTVSLVPQILKVAHTQSAEDISVGFLFIYLLASVLMFVYAYSICAYPLLINNSANVLSCILLLALYYKYTNRVQMLNDF